MSWETFFDKLRARETRDQAISKAISLIRTLAQPGLGIGKDLGIFSSDPGDPADIHFHHAMPVFQLPSRVSLGDQQALAEAVGAFNRAIVMIGGTNGLLTSVTVREVDGGGDWKVIRIGRSHLVQAFDKLNRLWEDHATITAGGREIAAEHLSSWPLAMLRMPDRRQVLLVLEVLGEPRKEVPFLFFPVYDDSELGFDEGQALTLEDLERALEKAPESLESPLVEDPDEAD